MAVEVVGGIRRGEVFQVDLDPTRGGEIRKMRPCVVVSPDELNAHLRTFIVAPLTTGGHPYPYRMRGSIMRKAPYPHPGEILLEEFLIPQMPSLIR
jgi:mRNA interferase MazF